ncbi:MAG: NAD(P)H-hydrate dehydratase [Candidatus Methanogranum gryphiswaldense]|nr:MAG: NAD(P)H-hydrate dehydratase [Candidatus Methanogranum sp. U3.2.1]
MISSLDSKVMDANSEALGITRASLMTHAGQAIADIIRTRYSNKRIAFACGKGNNGGDGYTAANILSHADVTILIISPTSIINSREAFEQYSKLKCPKLDFFSARLEDYDVIVDCALGTGLTGELKEPYVSYVNAMNGFKGDIISIDVPSGLGTDHAIKPKLTLALHDIKDGMTPENSGEIIVRDIGVPTEAIKNVGPGDMLRYPIPAKDSHKGCGGTLLVIGGGPYFGAPAMAAMAAMRVGTDIVKVATPSCSYPTIASFSPVLILTELKGNILAPGHVKKLLELSESCDAVLIGPGLGTDDLTIEAVNDFVNSCKAPMVIDADGLNALGKNFHSNGTPIVLTPHTGEFLRLGGTIGSDPAKYVCLKAKETNTTVLLKGSTDIISNGEKIRFNNTGNPGMTSAGTGDVLAGIIAGLLAKKMSAFDAACLGAYISGRAGDCAFKKKSYGLIATDIIEKIPTVLAKELR